MLKKRSTSENICTKSLGVRNIPRSYVFPEKAPPVVLRKMGRFHFVGFQRPNNLFHHCTPPALQELCYFWLSLNTTGGRQATYSEKCHFTCLEKHDIVQKSGNESQFSCSHLNSVPIMGYTQCTLVDKQHKQVHTGTFKQNTHRQLMFDPIQQLSSKQSHFTESFWLHSTH